MPQIELVNLKKTYRIHEREAGVKASLMSLFARRYKNLEAVKGVTFSLEEGEVVGFLGPNGAGKTTTLKMLAGLLYPTAGEARVLGYIPWRREKEYLRQISLVMGNRQQLLWDIPAMDSFLVNQAIYQVPEKQFRETLDELVALLDLEPILRKQVRSLSLGERMKCELAAALLHRPRVLFLDEPTLGVDVTMQGRIRQFVAEHNRRHGATVILTSHYMADVTALCRRVIIIHHGRLLYDGDLNALSSRIAPFKLVELDVESEEAASDACRYGEVLSRNGAKVTLKIPRADTSSAVARILSELPVMDLTVEDPPIEEIIDQLFRDEMLEAPQKASPEIEMEEAPA
ncbi:MAG: ABC transporter ATP-binding protein [Chthonomonadales bacterium]